MHGNLDSRCPICDHAEFDEFNGRSMARCKRCGALERGRVAWLAMQALDVARPDLDFLNLSPEPFMLFIGAEAIGGGYVAADYDPSLFSKWKKPIRRFDLCRDLPTEPEESWDVVMHNHTLEHVPCDVERVLRGLNRILRPGGVHLFSIPVQANGITREDLSTDLTPAQRRHQFGQEDHMRIFGELDLLDILDRAGMTDGLIDLAGLVRKDELQRAALRPDVLDTVNSDRVFAWRKR